MPQQSTEKLQKVLARLGYGSRREMETWISDGRISIDGRRAKLGDRVSADAQIRVDGKRVSKTRVRSQRSRVLLYHKPSGEVTTRRDPEGRPTVFDHLPNPGNGRWIAVGRLDINTSGLLLFTNNGELANRLMHPSRETEREYAVRIYGEVERGLLDNLRKGVELEDGPARFDTIREQRGEGKNRWYHVIIKEGRNREVRRLWESQGVKVSRLHRIRYGTVSLPRRIRLGRWEELQSEAVADLMRSVDLSPEQRHTRPAENKKAKGPWRGRAHRKL